MAGRTYVYDIARRLDLSSFGNGLEADSAKLFAAPIAKRVADRAVQILGGNGYTAEYQVDPPPPLPPVSLTFLRWRNIGETQS
jgi:alkylation response protein AidB-like acyl-CoA dehydrogenase